MIISENNGTFTAQHVTGPTHNTLRLKLAHGPTRQFTITVLPPIGSCNHSGGLTVEEITSEIKAGLAASNAALFSDYVVDAAAVIENDTRQPGIFEYMTRKIIEKAAMVRDEK